MSCLKSINEPSQTQSVLGDAKSLWTFGPWGLSVLGDSRSSGTLGPRGRSVLGDALSEVRFVVADAADDGGEAEEAGGRRRLAVSFKDKKKARHLISSVFLVGHMIFDGKTRLTVSLVYDGGMVGRGRPSLRGLFPAIVAPAGSLWKRDLIKWSIQ